MKKQLLSICAALAAGCAFAQTPSPSWTINQHAIFPANPGPLQLHAIEFLDAVDQNVVWAVGSDLNSRTWNQFSRTTNGGTSWTGGFIYPNPTNTAVSDTSVFHIANLEG